ncbi:MAG: hypothetical protein V1799_10415 [bacterium]
MFHPTESLLPDAISVDLYSKCLFILTVSERIAQKAGILRNTQAQYSDKIVIPKEEQLHQLQHSVTFTFDEFNDLGRKCGFRTNEYDPFCTPIGQVRIERFLRDFDEGDMIRTPIIKTRSSFIVSDSSALLPSLKHHIINVLEQNGLRDKFAQELRHKAWASVSTHLSWLEALPIKGLEPKEDARLSSVIGAFGFDVDKVMIVCLLTDDLVPRSNVNTIGDSSVLHVKLKELSDIFFLSKNPPNEIMYLFLFCHFLRWTKFQFCQPYYDFPALCLSSATLDIIATLEGGKNLFLYKYAIAQKRIRNRTQIISFDTMDEYGFFRSKKYSYYIGDETQPTMLYLPGDFARAVRTEALIKIDRHAVVTPSRDAITEVIKLHGDNTPVYIPRDIPSAVEVLLEAFTIPIWFVCENEKLSGDPRRIVIEMIEMFSFWLYEMREALELIFLQIKQLYSQFVIQIKIDEKADWNSWRPSEPPLRDEAYLICDITTKEMITVEIYPAIVHKMYGQTNEGERFAIGILLRALGEVVRRNLASDPFGTTSIEQLLNKYAPLGRKKKISTVDTITNPELDPRGIDDPRLVDEMDIESMLDDVGEHVTSLKLKIEDDPGKQATFINEHIVSHLFSELKKEVATYRATDLIETLIGQNEALVREKALIEMQMPMQLEIADQSKISSMFEERSKKISESSIASRFLIEYVAAQPPSGIRPVSEASLDRLVAIAEQIVSWGFTSDLLYYNIGNMKVKLLDSGRVGRTREQYEKALSAFTSQYFTRYSSHLLRVFQKHWSSTIKQVDPPDERTSDLLMEVNTGMLEEFGYTLDDYSNLVGCLHSIALKSDLTIYVGVYENIHQSLTSDGKIPPERIAVLLEALVFEPRTEFFSHPKFSGKHHYYPWRFNRQVSYIRRPLIVELRNGIPYIHFGVRMLWTAFNNFFGTIVSGRLHSQVKSTALQRIISKLREPYGRQFNEKVAQQFKKSENVIVDSNIKRFGKVEMEFGRGQSLGDIDVIVLYPQDKIIDIIECKDLLLSRTPYEFHQELKELFDGPQSHLAKHLRRVEWVRKNLDVVLNRFRIVSKEDWKVRSSIVIDEPLMAPHLSPDPQTRIILYEQIAN